MHEGHTRRAWVAAMAAAGLGLAPGARAADVQPWPARRAAPRLAATGLDGRRWELPLPGRAVVLNFWASWCEPCRTEMATLRTLADLYGERLAVLALNHKEHPATVMRFTRAIGLTLPVLLDPQGEHARAWEVKVFPTTIGIAPDGVPRWRVRGEWDWTSAEAGRLVEGLWS